MNNAEKYLEAINLHPCFILESISMSKRSGNQMKIFGNLIGFPLCEELQ